jgi:hypothetical protein
MDTMSTDLWREFILPHLEFKDIRELQMMNKKMNQHVEDSRLIVLAVRISTAKNYWSTYTMSNEEKACIATYTLALFPKTLSHFTLFESLCCLVRNGISHPKIEKYKHSLALWTSFELAFAAICSTHFDWVVKTFDLTPNLVNLMIKQNNLTVLRWLKTKMETKMFEDLCNLSKNYVHAKSDESVAFFLCNGLTTKPSTADLELLCKERNYQMLAALQKQFNLSEVSLEMDFMTNVDPQLKVVLNQFIDSRPKRMRLSLDFPPNH